jgi:hypothetical protein
MSLTSAVGESYRATNVLRTIILRSRNYEIGITKFPLRSRNKTEGFPITP